MARPMYTIENTAVSRNGKQIFVSYKSDQDVTTVALFSHKQRVNDVISLRNTVYGLIGQKCDDILGKVRKSTGIQVTPKDTQPGYKLTHSGVVDAGKTNVRELGDLILLQDKARPDSVLIKTIALAEAMQNDPVEASDHGILQNAVEVQVPELKKLSPESQQKALRILGVSLEEVAKGRNYEEVDAKVDSMAKADQKTVPQAEKGTFARVIEWFKKMLHNIVNMFKRGHSFDEAVKKEASDDIKPQTPGLGNG